MAAAAAGGCGSKPPEDIGVARLEITSIPTDVSCLRLTAVGARTVVQQFDVTPGANASLLVTGLPTGMVVINADAFAATCAMAGDRTTANWVSEPQTLNIATDAIVDLSLVMHRNGRVRVGVDFTDDVAPTCSDGIKNGTETDVDCGGGCPKCGPAKCRTDADCPAGSSCFMFSCRVNPPTCGDGIQNGDETGVDCGGAACPKCGPASCRTDADCPAGQSCASFTCRTNPPTCGDGIQNGDETGVDCGGATCPKCLTETKCRTDADCPTGQSCASFVCRAGLSCTLPSGAVAWWRAENNTLDALGAHDGTAFGNVSFVPGEVGSAFGFDGVTLGYVSSGPSPDLDGAGGLTIDAWINVGAGDTGRIVDKIRAWTQDGYLFDLLSGFLRIQVGGVGLVSPERVPTGTFVHVAAAYDATRIALFVNGARVAEAPSGAPVPISDLSLRIGADSDGGSLFPGAIDEPRLFNRALTDAEVHTLFLQATNCP